MEKIRLSNGAEFMLVPMGIETRDKLRCFKFISELNYYDILADFSNTDNLLIVEHILADGTVGATYSDCVAYKSLTFVPNVQVDDNTVSDIYVVAISIDPVERALKETNSNIHTTMAVVDMVLTEFLPLLMN